MPVVVFLFYVLSCAILNYQYWNMMCEAACKSSRQTQSVDSVIMMHDDDLDEDGGSMLYDNGWIRKL